MSPGPSLLRRWPRLRWRPRVDAQIVPAEVRADYACLAEDFSVLERELLPHFRAFDNEALRTQNRYRLEQVALIFGGTLATVLGAVQVAFTGADWPGLLEALLATFLGLVALRAKTDKIQERYLTSRLKAEMLRREYFLFLGRLGPYGEIDRIQHLIRQVAKIRAGKGGATHG